MSVDPEIELLEDPRILRTGEVDVKVKFIYPDGSTMDTHLTLPKISGEEEFWRILEDSWWHNRPEGKTNPQIIIDGDLKKGKKRKFKQ